MKKKILFILPTLTAGGAERVISFIAQNINKSKFDSKLLVTGYEKDAAYLIDDIEVEFFKKKRVLNAVSNIFIYLLKHRPNVVVSSIGHLNTVMGLMSPFFLKTKFIIREASVISLMDQIHNERTTKKSFSIYEILSRASYKLVDKIICQSKDMADDFINIYNVKKQNIAIINNPITNYPPLKKVDSAVQKPIRFITVGRLSKEKGQLRVIELLSKLKFPFHYTIIGDGPIKDDILEAIKTNQLVDRFTYIPFTKEVSKHMSSNDMFLQGSYVEGFPNTVLESCFVGTPVLAFNVPGGTKEIIQHQVNGYLVENEEEYFYYLNNKLTLEPQKVRDSVKMKFDKNKILKQYESLFN
ncbi:glycosyltransferase [Winogradskyella sp. F6397]|uniref:Glycosyltransferase n=1 Tax=Winogradskyella marina TaxID=2785530 RepID=A0ABS0EJ28_9FLAO|nr:glycosyltransferase [Winogradskyella marina]MBF8149562.1 glycosyltransferase [Winogradskyella marina]